MTRNGRRYDEWEPEAPEYDGQQQLANGLGWFSIGLGLAEIVAPSKVAQLIGVRDEDKTRSLLRFYGMREIAAGVGILTQPNPAGWMWGRVAGDLLDLSTLMSTMRSDDTDRGRAATATAAVLGVTALDVLCAQRLSDRAGEDGASRRGGVQVRKTISISRSPEEVYRFWRQFENLPRFMDHLESVQDLGGGRSHWRAKAPAGRTVEWDAEIIDDQPNSFIAWRSLEGADVDNSGSVSFERASGGRGTVVRVELEYAPPGGAVGALFAKLFGEEPGQQIDDDLRRFKQIIEVGEVVKSDASIHPGMHPAQPPAW